LADLEIALIHQIQKRVKEEGQEIEAEQEGRQEMISVTEVMFERIAFVFEHVVILVLDLPARPAIPHHGFHGCL